MASKKFSQIALSGAPITSGDFLVGVQGGTADVLFSQAQIGRSVLTANANYYVAATGSDANPGTLASPFATIQHAMNVVSQTLDGGGFYGVTINIGAGTFVGVSVTPCNSMLFLQFNGAGSASTTLTHTPHFGVNPFSLGGCIDVLNDIGCPIGINNMTLFEDLNDVDTISCYVPGVYLYIGDYENNTTTDVAVTCPATGVFSNQAAFGIYTQSQIVLTAGSPAGTIKCNGANQNTNNLFRLWDGAVAVILGAKFDFTGTPTYNSLIFANAESIWDASQSTVAFTNSFTGSQFQLTNNSSIETNNVAIPGSSDGTADNTCTYNGSPLGNRINAFPSSTDLPFHNQFGLFDIVPVGGRQFAYNDSGTVVPATRILLSANATFYVDNVAGSNSNPGTAALPFQTLQHAWDFLSANLDLASFNLTIHLVASATAYLLDAESGWVGGSNVNITGAGSASTKLQDLAFGNNSSFVIGPIINIDGVTLTEVASANAAVVAQGAIGTVNISSRGGDVVLGTSVQQFIGFGVFGFGATLTLFDISYNGFAGAFTQPLTATSGGFLLIRGAVSQTVVGAPTYGTFAVASTQSGITANSGFTGAATAKRYDSQSLGLINTNGGGANFFPGNVAGTTGTGGQYL